VYSEGIILKCLLVSFFNSGNLGDCLIGESLYSQVSSYFETQRYSYSGSYDVITNINDIKATNLNERKNFNGKVYDKLKEMNLTLPIVLYRKFKKTDYNLEPLQKKLSNVDTLVIGGGNMIFDKDRYSNSALRFDSFVSLAKEKNKKVFAISIGIGPFQTERQEKNAILALNKCDYITFRDQKSYDIYAKRTSELDNVFISIDPVFSLPYKMKDKLTKTQTIGINIFNSKLIDASNEDYRRLIRNYIKLIDTLIENLGVNVILFSTDLKDYSAVKDVQNHFHGNTNVETREINGFTALLDLYQIIDILIASRMHSMIIAYTQRIPLVGLSWQPKVEAFFEIIDSKDCVFNYNALGENLENIILMTRTKLDNLDKEKYEIEEKLIDIRKQRRVDEEILLKLNI
jgi:polysaccharide pyruvyl transferase WcaK-like protein